MKFFTKNITFILLFAVTPSVVYIAKESYQRKKYENTKLNIETAELKQSWGNPDYEMVNNDKSKVLKYKYWNGYYIFITDSTAKKIVAKFDDD